MALSPDALAEHVYSVLTRLVRRLRNSQESNELSLERLNTLRLIDTKGPLSVADLAQIEGVHASTMSRMTSSLANGGLVRRVPYQRDGRGALLKLTPRGQTAQRQALRRRLQIITAGLSRLSAKDRATVERALCILEESMLPESGSADSPAGKETAVLKE